MIACSRLDHERVKTIAERLISLGYSVWWDKYVGGRQAPVDEYVHAFEQARCVLALWSHNARDALPVFAQASAAHDAGKLVQARLDTAPVTAPFDALPAADLASERAGGWGVLEDVLAKLVRNNTAPEPLRPVGHAGLLASPAPAGAPKLVTFAIAASACAFAGAVSAASLGVMTTEQLQVALTGILGVGGVCGALTAHRIVQLSRAGD